MAVISRSTLDSYVQASTKGPTNADRGRALEDLICYLFTQVPGISIARRNQSNVFHTEEIDVALWNDAHTDGFFFLPNIILVECKNWSTRVGSAEVSWFDTKLRSRGLSFGILIAANGVTGNAQELTAAYSIIAAALRERRQLVILTSEELYELTESPQLVRLMKEKLCDLAVRGAFT